MGTWALTQMLGTVLYLDASYEYFVQFSGDELEQSNWEKYLDALFSPALTGPYMAVHTLGAPTKHLLEGQNTGPIYMLLMYRWSVCVHVLQFIDIKM